MRIAFQKTGKSDVQAAWDEHALENAQTLNRILRLAAQPHTLGEILNQSLAILLETNWLSVLPKGGIFLVRDEACVLELVAHYNLDEELLTLCARVPFGRCLCGRAAERKQTVHAGCVDQDHEVRSEDMEPHGHYNVPILDEQEGTVHGVLVLYLPEGHERCDSETSFLERVGDILSLVIRLKRKETQLREKSEFLEMIQDNMEDGVVLLDDDLRFAAFNRRFLEMHGFGQDFIKIGDSAERLIRASIKRGDYGEGDEEKLVRERLAPLTGKEPFNFEKKLLSCGTILEVRGRPLPMGGVITCYTDITKRKKAEETIRRMALEDPLTGLPNRTQFRRRLADALHQAERTGLLVGLLMMDLDDFKNVNDTLGHPAGDLLLKEVAVRLMDCARKTDTVARLGGDEFAIIATNAPSYASFLTLAERIIEEIAFPFDVGGTEVRTGASIGLAVFPNETKDADQLLSNADLALYRAKGKGKGTVEVFDERMNRDFRRRRILEDELRAAVVHDEFLFHYQPQIDLKTGQITGAEALLRWDHPERGLLAPADFMDVAESSGIMIEIGAQVMRRACQEAMQWREWGRGDLTIAVNLTARHFRRRALVDEIRTILEESGLAAHRLELEITESMVAGNTEEAVNILNQLKGLGLRLVIDDFGTGYSSLSNIRYFPVDKLKIDRSFIRGVAEKWDCAAICRSVIQLGHSFNLTVVAEGVENAAQQAALVEMGCDQAQGYLFAKPLNAEIFGQRVREA
jgi:diguanylate cyclase (GGDEF)-like protein